jgi:hypothetical protein
MLPTVDVILAGEVMEWESAAYVQDVAFAGLGKGFISIGRVVNEAAGMQVCAMARNDRPGSADRFVAAERSLLEAAVMARLTAGEVVNRIKAVMAVRGSAWSDADNARPLQSAADTVVTGIATTHHGHARGDHHCQPDGPQPGNPARGHLLERRGRHLDRGGDTLVYTRQGRLHDEARHGISGIHDHMHGSDPTSRTPGTAARSLDPLTETARTPTGS